jgi:hypothetical protein
VQQRNDALCRSAGQIPAIIYVIGAFLTGIYDEGLPRITIKTVSRHLDDREASSDPPPVSLAGQTLWLTTVNAIAQARRNRRHQTAVKCRKMADNLH